MDMLISTVVVVISHHIHMQNDHQSNGYQSIKSYALNICNCQVCLRKAQSQFNNIFVNSGVFQKAACAPVTLVFAPADTSVATIPSLLPRGQDRRQGFLHWCDSGGNGPVTVQYHPARWELVCLPPGTWFLPSTSLRSSDSCRASCAGGLHPFVCVWSSAHRKGFVCSPQHTAEVLTGAPGWSLACFILPSQTEQ